jgi:elongation factor Ts
MVQTNKTAAEAGHKVAMQVAAMKPVALDADSVSQEILDNEYKTAVEKTKLEQCQKAVEAALKKAGYNLYIAENEEHLAEGIAKGNITEAQADDIRRIKVEVAEEKAKNLPAQMIENIAKGRVAKFLKENCLVDQEFQFGDGDKATVSQWLATQDKELKVVAFQRFTLAAE